MIDSISIAAQDRAQDTLGVTIALAQGFAQPALRALPPPNAPAVRDLRDRRSLPTGASRNGLHLTPRIHAEYGSNHLGDAGEHRAGAVHGDRGRHHADTVLACQVGPL